MQWWSRQRRSGRRGLEWCIVSDCNNVYYRHMIAYDVYRLAEFCRIMNLEYNLMLLFVKHHRNSSLGQIIQLFDIYIYIDSIDIDIDINIDIDIDLTVLHSAVHLQGAQEDWEPQIRWRDERYEALAKIEIGYESLSLSPSLCTAIYIYIHTCVYTYLQTVY